MSTVGGFRREENPLGKPGNMGYTDAMSPRWEFELFPLASIHRALTAASCSKRLDHHNMMYQAT